jgi:hypothetical protein
MMMMVKRLSVIGCLAAITVASGAVQASTNYCVVLSSSSTPTCTPNSAAPVSASFSGPSGAASAAAGLGSSPASLGVSAMASSTTQLDSVAKGYAALSGFQVAFSGPSGGSTTTSLNLNLSGALSDWFDWGLYRHTKLEVATTLSGSQGSVTDHGQLVEAYQFVCDQLGGCWEDYFGSANGILGGLVWGEGEFSTSSLSIVDGDTVFLSMSLLAEAFCITEQIQSCRATMNYLDTLQITAGGPVFDLPAGWTANSLDGSIVNNMLW